MSGSAILARSAIVAALTGLERTSTDITIDGTGEAIRSVVGGHWMDEAEFLRFANGHRLNATHAAQPTGTG